MKKKIVIFVFLTLILITAIVFMAQGIAFYKWEMDPANNVQDSWKGMGLGFAIIIGGLVILYELDLFCTVYYFFIIPKTIEKSILNVLAHISLILIFFADYYKNLFSDDSIVILIVGTMYFVLRTTYFIVHYSGSNCK